MFVNAIILVPGLPSYRCSLTCHPVTHTTARQPSKLTQLPAALVFLLLQTGKLAWHLHPLLVPCPFLGLNSSSHEEVKSISVFLDSKGSEVLQLHTNAGTGGFVLFCLVCGEDRVSSGLVHSALRDCGSLTP